MIEEDEKSAEAEVREKLLKLRALKSQLDGLDAEIGKLVPEIETMLDSLRLGVPINVKMHEYEGQAYRMLEFTKIGKQWRLAVSDGTPGEDDWDVTPLSDVARDLRAEVFEDFIPKILGEAIVEMERRIAARGRTIKLTKSLVDTVRKVDVSPVTPALGVFKGEDKPAVGAFNTDDAEGAWTNPLAATPLAQAALNAAGAFGAAALASAANAEAKKGNLQRATELMDAAKAAAPPRRIINAPKKVKR